MAFIKRWILLILILFMAIFFYGIGSKSGIVGFFLIGFLCEATFWFYGVANRKFKKRI